jgi:hypothetical protein
MFTGFKKDILLLLFLIILLLLLVLDRLSLLTQKRCEEHKNLSLKGWNSSGLCHNFTLNLDLAQPGLCSYSSNMTASTGMIS